MKKLTNSIKNLLTLCSFEVRVVFDVGLNLAVFGQALKKTNILISKYGTVPINLLKVIISRNVPYDICRTPFFNMKNE
jgi:hypothetical protein